MKDDHNASLPEEKSKKLSVVGSRYWMAPEMIRRESYTAKVDIWSLAALCYEMVEVSDHSQLSSLCHK